MLVAVPMRDIPTVVNAMPLAGDKPADSAMNPPDSRAGAVDHIVKASGGPAEMFIPFVAMPDHGVERIHRLIRQRQRRATERQVDQRSNDSVGTAFGNRFDGARAISPSDNVSLSRPTIIDTAFRAPAKSPAARRRSPPEHGREIASGQRGIRQTDADCCPGSDSPLQPGRSPKSRRRRLPQEGERQTGAGDV